MSETDAVPLSKRRKLLRTFRKQYGITLDELGDLTDLSKSMLSLFDNGERDLSSEAWTRVLTAMSNLIADDNAKRLAEIAKAKETATKLGAFGVPGDVLEHLLKSDEQFAKEQAEIDAERIRLEEQGKLSDQILSEQKDNALAYILANPETVLQMYVEKDRRIAELEEELRALKSKGPQIDFDAIAKEHGGKSDG